LVETIATPFYFSLDRVRQRRKPNAVTALDEPDWSCAAILGDQVQRRRIR
jgi:hypothetical protein